MWKYAHCLGERGGTAIETPSDIASDLVEDESESEPAETESPPEDEPAVSAAEPTDEGTERSDGWDSVDDPVKAPGDSGVGDNGGDDEPVDPSADDAEISMTATAREAATWNWTSRRRRSTSRTPRARSR